jgi:hypothetical protein
MSWGGTCTSYTPVYQCIQQGQTIGAFARYNCTLGDYNCMATQQYWQSRCPPGVMQSYCVNQYYQYQQQQQQTRLLEAAALGGVLGGSLGVANALMGKKQGSARDAVEGRSRNSNAGSPASIRAGGDGKLDSCGTISAAAAKARDEAIDFRGRCRAAQRNGNNQKIVINDYSGDGVPTMWIFNVDGKTCYGKTSVSFGSGFNEKKSADNQCLDRGNDRPLPCSEDGCHTTPPGFHLTGRHNGENYDETNSMSMVALEGQGSDARHVLIHVGSSPGSNNTWGCSGIGCFNQVKSLVSYGALVYNYFGDAPLAPNCRNDAGMPNHRDPENNCHQEPGTDIPDEGGGTSTQQ